MKAGQETYMRKKLLICFKITVNRPWQNDKKVSGFLEQHIKEMIFC